MKQTKLYSKAVAYPPLLTGADTYSVFEYQAPDTHCIAVRNQEDTFFAGHTTNGVLSSWIMGDIPQRVIDLAVKAINNRTRERNFYRLGEQLALGEISEEEYDHILEEHEDDYIIKCDFKPSEMDMKVAAHLAPKIIDVKDTDDLAVLFSFDESEIKNYLED